MFVSNLMALVFAGMVVFASLARGEDHRAGARGRAYAATTWLSATPGAPPVDAQAHARTLYVTVCTPAALPPVDVLLADLGGQVPDGVPVVVTAGSRSAGSVADSANHPGRTADGVVAAARTLRA
ncbi:hypothetical protein [Kitasatospora sp. NBC_01300]|uniref:hypothetical protein n=1 Tax=Kitasatospora sp. NBC_01300 TaxID=2903574 RepID=UPI00352FAEDE|nr:hypothetical protein OG556_35215 [Kitasatospora sp. NBC_01300]